jgi:hypothetical protein
LKVTQHQPATTKVQSEIADNSGRCGNASVRVYGYDDIAETRQTLGEVAISGMARYRYEAVGTRTSECVLNVDIEVFARSGNPSTCGMVAMEQNKECVR